MYGLWRCARAIWTTRAAKLVFALGVAAVGEVAARGDTRSVPVGVGEASGGVEQDFEGAHERVRWRSIYGAYVAGVGVASGVGDGDVVTSGAGVGDGSVAATGAV